MFPVPTVRLVVAASLLSLVVLVTPLPTPWGFVAAVGALALAGGADLILAPDPSAIAVQRVLPHTLTLASGGGEVRWRITNPSRRSLRITVADELAPSLRPGTRRFRVTVPPLGTATSRAELNPTRRGRFEP